MAQLPPQWADASERSNDSRLDLPSTYVLRLTEAACSELGIDPPDPHASFSTLHELVRKFADVFKSASAIDSGVPFSQMPGRGLYRIRAQEWRGIVWADRDSGIVWLCRAASLSDYPHEDQLYDALAAHGEGIFPPEKEREEAESAQLVAHAMRALREAMQEAHEVPEKWCEAKMRGAHQSREESETIGHAYVEQLKDEDEVLVDRFLVTTAVPLGSLSVENWLALVQRLFPVQDGQPFFIAPGDLPDGIIFTPGVEVALAQQA